MKINCPYCTKEFNLPEQTLRVGNPTLICTGCNGKFKAKKVEKKERVFASGDNGVKQEQPERPKGNQGAPPTEFVSRNKQESNREYFGAEPGWLVVHDENTKQQTFSLKKGKQLIGRKSTSKPCEIMIETEDIFMSRNHFYVDVIRGKNGDFSYVLSDCNALNHTFINLKKLASNDEMYLKDGDTIQAGETKIVFKSNKGAGSSAEATDFVGRNDYSKTVYLKK